MIPRILQRTKPADNPHSCVRPRLDVTRTRRSKAISGLVCDAGLIENNRAFYPCVLRKYQNHNNRRRSSRVVLTPRTAAAMQRTLFELSCTEGLRKSRRIFGTMPALSRKERELSLTLHAFGIGQNDLKWRRIRPDTFQRRLQHISRSVNQRLEFISASSAVAGIEQLSRCLRQSDRQCPPRHGCLSAGPTESGRSSSERSLSMLAGSPGTVYTRQTKLLKLDAFDHRLKRRLEASEICFRRYKDHEDKPVTQGSGHQPVSFGLSLAVCSWERGSRT